METAVIDGRLRARRRRRCSGVAPPEITTSLGVLLWGESLLSRHVSLRDEVWAQIAKLNEHSSLGAGIYGYCPCSFDDLGLPVWQRIGHSGGTTSLQYDGGQDLLFTLQVPRGVWGANTIPLEILLETLTNIVADHAFKEPR